MRILWTGRGDFIVKNVEAILMKLRSEVTSYNGLMKHYIDTKDIAGANSCRSQREAMRRMVCFVTGEKYVYISGIL